ncbi:MAG TPA: phosphoribosylformylglycinamidine cyclo-ligase [Nitrososphaera sp.]|nr:phosphoribosylformylglycinamidine cyclo-ligase [Nitrososphaera sp.]
MAKEEGMTYSSAGVDTKKIRNMQNSIGAMIASTQKKLPKGVRVKSGFGHYAGLVTLGSELLALHSDGVGTKVLIAQLTNKYDTIGIDCVAMNVNDIICVGARPAAFVDYIALKEPNEDLVRQVMAGLVRGAEMSEMAIVGGETAVLPDIISGIGENALDLAGTALGWVKGNPVLGKSIRAGDIILGVESSGLHSNGYSLARKVLLSKYSVDDTPEHLMQTLGEELLVPTRIYVRPVMELVEKARPAIHGLANITGGSFTKLARLNDTVNYVLDSLPEPPGIFRQIQADGRVDTLEMYKTFNMGVGYCVIAPKQSAERVIKVFDRHGMRCAPIGTVEKGDGKVVSLLEGKKQILQL